GNIRLSYNKGSYQSLIESAFYEEYDGWIYNGGSANGNIELESGRLKVNVLNPYNGASIIIGDSFVTGAQVDISIEVDKAGTDKIYAVVQELDTNNNVIAIYNMNSNLHTGSYNFSHTVVSGEKLRLKIAKSNTDVGNPTHFYIDNVYASTGEPEIVEENNYYPFGLKHKGYGAPTAGVDHKYGFGGKEEQDELGLNWIDITARNYDPALGRWMNIDPLAEMMRRHSPYNYAFDNPVYYIDPDGMEPIGIGGLEDDNNFDKDEFGKTKAPLEPWQMKGDNPMGYIGSNNGDGDSNSSSSSNGEGGCCGGKGASLSPNAGNVGLMASASRELNGGDSNTTASSSLASIGNITGKISSVFGATLL